MSGIISSVKKSAVFDAENAFVVVVFRKSSATNNRLQKAALSGSSAYSCTYNLAVLYDDDEYRDNEGVFKANKAFNAFKSEFPVNYEDKDINLYDIPVSEVCGHEKLLVVESKNEMMQAHPACYGDINQARQLAKRMILKGLQSGVFRPINDDDDADEGDDE